MCTRTITEYCTRSTAGSVIVFIGAFRAHLGGWLDILSISQCPRKAKRREGAGIAILTSLRTSKIDLITISKEPKLCPNKSDKSIRLT